MRIYYFEDPLSTEDARFVQEALELSRPCEQVRIPQVLPAGAPRGNERSFRRHQAMVGTALCHAGIAADRNRQVILVAPRHLYWYSVLVQAVYRQTGAFPWLVQTEEQRAALGNPGSTRLLDGQGLMGELTGPPAG